MIGISSLNFRFCLCWLFVMILLLCLKNGLFVRLIVFGRCSVLIICVLCLIYVLWKEMICLGVLICMYLCIWNNCMWVGLSDGL